MKGVSLAARYVWPILIVDGVRESVSGVLSSRGQWEMDRSVPCEWTDAQVDLQLAASTLCTDGQCWNRLQKPGGLDVRAFGRSLLIVALSTFGIEANNLAQT